MHADGRLIIYSILQTNIILILNFKNKIRWQKNTRELKNNDETKCLNSSECSKCNNASHNYKKIIELNYLFSRDVSVVGID